MARTKALIEPRQFLAEYEGKTATQLREALESLLAVGAETFARMAAIVQVADEQGVTEHLGLQGYQTAALRRIGRGEVVPEAYARFGGTPLERSLPALSPARQRDLADGGTEYEMRQSSDPGWSRSKSNATGQSEARSSSTGETTR